MVYPFVPNGDFENDSAGDMYPDWWFVWGVGKDRKDNSKFYDHIRLDNSRKIEGKYSLMIDPHPDADDMIIAQPMVSLLKANKRYKVSVYIYREAESSGVFAQIKNLRLGSTGYHKDKWERFEGEFQVGEEETAPSPKRDDWIRGIRLYNKTRSPAWFDNLIIKEIINE